MIKAVKTMGAILAGFTMVAASPMPENPLTDTQARQLISRLDLTQPGLTDAAAAVQQGDWQKARQVVAGYFRQKAAAVPKRPIERSSIPLADKTVAGEVTVVWIPHHFPEGEIQWGFNPTKAEGKSYDPEWLWQLNRMSFWPNLTRAYQATGDEKYARTFVRHLRSWAAYWKAPKGHDGGHHSAWRTIECGIRMAVTWPMTFAAMAPSASVTDDDILLYLHCSLIQAAHLQQYPKTGNWLTMEMNGLYTFAADHPEFRECDGWRKFAVEKLLPDLKKQILPDGAQYELSPGYHMVALNNAAALLKKAEATGHGREIPPEFRRLIHMGYRFIPWIMTPDRKIPKLNDSWLVDVPRAYRQLGQLFPDDPLIGFAARGAKVEEAPEVTSCFFPCAGYAVFRQNWQTDGHYLLFDVGPLGRSHVHQDKLNLVLYGYGEELLFDDGGGNYERSKYRDYACSSADHSVVHVDGQGQNRQKTPENLIAPRPINARFVTTPKADYAEGSFDEFAGDAKGITHRRQVWYIKPDLFLICDRLTPQDKAAHRYQARWQVDTLKMLEGQGGPGILRSDRQKKADLLIVPLLTDGLQVRWISDAADGPEMGGLYVGREPRPYRPAVTVLHERSGAGEQLFLTLLCPVRAGSGDLITRVESPAPLRRKIFFSDGRVLDVTIPRDGRRPPVWKL